MHSPRLTQILHIKATLLAQGNNSGPKHDIEATLPREKSGPRHDIEATLLAQKNNSGPRHDILRQPCCLEKQFGSLSERKITVEFIQKQHGRYSLFQENERRLVNLLLLLSTIVIQRLQRFKSRCTSNFIVIQTSSCALRQ